MIVTDAMSRDPVSEAGQLLGILTDRDVEHAAFVPAHAEALAWEPRWLKAPRVRDVMTWQAMTAPPHVPLLQAALIMFQHRIGSLLVVDGGRLVGILIGRSVLAALEAMTPCSAAQAEEGATWTSRTS